MQISSEKEYKGTSFSVYTDANAQYKCENNSVATTAQSFSFLS